MTRGLLAAIAAAGALLRLWGLGRESFWHDESWTWALLQGGPVDVLVRLAKEDAHPPLYFLLMWPLGALGASEAWLRLPSALAGIAAIPLLFRVVRRLGGDRAGLAAALFLALSPFAVKYSREARSYAVLFLLCLAALDLLLTLRERPGSKAWVPLGLVAGAIPLVHYLGALYLVGLAVAVPVWGAPPWKPLLRAAALSVAVFLPWLLPFLDHARTISGSFWIPEPTWRIVSYSMGELVAGSHGTPRHALPFLVLVAVLPAVLRSRDFAGWLVFAALPPLLELLVSLHRPIFYTQTFLFVLVPVFASAGLAMGRMRTRPGAAATLLLALTLVPGLARQLGGLHKEDWRGAAERLAESPGEPVFVVPGYVGVSLEYYRVPRERLRLVNAGDMLTPPVPEAAAREEAARPGPVWLAWRHDADEGWEAALAKGRRVTREWRGNGVRLKRYE